MNAARWRLVEPIVDAAADLDPEAREGVLDVRCAGDSALRQEVERVLAALDSGGDFLERATWAPRRSMEKAGIDDPSLEPGTRLGAYRILSFLGGGGMGSVYRARRDDGRFNKDVAVKVVRGDLRHPGARQRFERERFLLARLDHPNIARLYDAGTTEDGRPYFVMELVEGEPIDAYCAGRHLRVVPRLRILLQVCRAVEAAHRHLIIHRDLKPSNILVTHEGDVKLLDFGLAKWLEPEGLLPDGQQTASHLRPMTPRYASPEQVSGEALTTATDVHGLGLLLFKILTGRLPHDEIHPLDLPRAILEDEAPRPSQAMTSKRSSDGGKPPSDGESLARRLQGDLDAIVLKALRKEPRSRYRSVSEFAEDIRRHLNHRPVTARRGSMRYRTGKFLRRHGVVVAALSGLFLLTILAALSMRHLAVEASAARDLAQAERDQAERVGEFLVDMFEVSHPSDGIGSDLSSRRLLDLSVQRLEGGAGRDPRLRARLLETLGRVYRNLGARDQARDMLEESYQIRLQQLGADHPEVATSLQALALVEFDSGRYAEAKSLASQSIDGLGESGQEVELLANSLLIQARALVVAGDLAQAEDLCRQALDLLRDSTEPTRVEARALSLLGGVLVEQGKLDPAEATLVEALGEERAVLGRDHPAVAETLANLSDLSRRLGDFDLAVAHSREAVRIRRALLPPIHPLLGSTLSHLGAALAAQGNLVESETVRREALEIAQEIYPGDHANRAIAMNELAVVLQAQGRAEESVDLHQQALAMRRRVFGDSHLFIAQSYYSLARALRDAGRPVEAEAALEKGVELAEASPQAPDFPEVGLLYVELAQTRFRNGQAKAALPWAEKGLATLGRGFPARHRLVRGAKVMIGDILIALERFAEAESYLLAVDDSRVAPEGRRTPIYPVDARPSLIRLYEQWNKPEAAARYRELISREDPGSSKHFQSR